MLIPGAILKLILYKMRNLYLYKARKYRHDWKNLQENIACGPIKLTGDINFFIFQQWHNFGHKQTLS